MARQALPACTGAEGPRDLQQAIDIFNREHARSVMERLKEDIEKRPEQAF
jgi:hypothetical protein